MPLEDKVREVCKVYSEVLSEYRVDPLSERLIEDLEFAMFDYMDKYPRMKRDKFAPWNVAVFGTGGMAAGPLASSALMYSVNALGYLPPEQQFVLGPAGFIAGLATGAVSGMVLGTIFNLPGLIHNAYADVHDIYIGAKHQEVLERLIGELEQSRNDDGFVELVRYRVDLLKDVSVYRTRLKKTMRKAKSSLDDYKRGRSANPKKANDLVRKALAELQYARDTSYVMLLDKEREYLKNLKADA